MPGINSFGKDNCKMRRETSIFFDIGVSYIRYLTVLLCQTVYGIAPNCACYYTQLCMLLHPTVHVIVPYHACYCTRLCMPLHPTVYAIAPNSACGCRMTRAKWKQDVWQSLCRSNWNIPREQGADDLALCITRPSATFQISFPHK